MHDTVPREATCGQNVVESFRVGTNNHVSVELVLGVVTRPPTLQLYGLEFWDNIGNQFPDRIFKIVREISAVDIPYKTGLDLPTWTSPDEALAFPV